MEPVFLDVTTTITPSPAVAAAGLVAKEGTGSMQTANVTYSGSLVNPVAATLARRLREGSSLLDAERWLWTWLLGLGACILQMALCKVLVDNGLTRPIHRAVRTLRGGMRGKGRREVTLHTLFGKVVVNTSYWVRNLRGRRGARRKKRRKTGSGLYPVLWWLGVRHRRTPAVQAEVSRAMVLCACCREASSLLEERGIHISPKDVCKLTYRVGLQAQQQRDRILAEPELLDESERILVGRRVVLQLDGGRYKQRIPNKQGRPTAKGRKGFKTAWKEPKGFIIYVLDEQGRPDKSVRALADFTTDDADELMRLIQASLKAYGIAEAIELSVCADGAHWIWNRVAQLKEAMTRAGYAGPFYEVLDFYHAVEHLGALSQLPGRGWSKHRRRHWLTRQRRRLLRGERDEVLAAIDKLGGDVSKRKRKDFEREREYFAGDNFERIRFGLFEHNNIPRGSGAIESLIRRVVNQRVKGNGCFWLQEHAEIIMHMRAQMKVGRFDQMILRATSPYAVAS